MRSFQAQHPEEGWLLRYLDGELPARKARQLEKHLKACWQCRTELAALQSTVAECVRYRRDVLEALLPPPPNPWPDIYRDFARIDESLSREPLWRRWLGPLTGGGFLRWAVTGVAALAVVCGLLYELRVTPRVEAAALLKRAVAGRSAAPGGAAHSRADQDPAVHADHRRAADPRG